MENQNLILTKTETSDGFRFESFIVASGQKYWDATHVVIGGTLDGIKYTMDGEETKIFQVITAGYTSTFSTEGMFSSSISFSNESPFI